MLKRSHAPGGGPILSGHFESRRSLRQQGAWPLSCEVCQHRTAQGGGHDKRDERRLCQANVNFPERK